MLKIKTSRVRRKAREWLARYMPAEISGTVCGVGSAWLTLHTTDNLALAAVIGTLSETIGYYIVILSGDVRQYYLRHYYDVEHTSQPDDNAKRKHLLAALAHVMRGAVVEFGPAEILDSPVVRPGLLYAIPARLNLSSGIEFLIAKLAADVVFYSLAICGYELRQRLAGMRTTASLSSQTDYKGVFATQDSVAKSETIEEKSDEYDG